MFLLLLFGTVVSSSAFFLDTYFYEFNCTEDQYFCRNSKCIPLSQRCNGKNDCGDASDEKNCEMYLCKDSKFFKCKNKRCIAKSFVCDGDNDCDDFSDEQNCESFKLSLNATATCEEGHWQCSDKLCIPNEWVCNGEEDCLDGSDEGIGCTSNIDCDGFKCKNGHCLPNEWVCDGHDDCHDNSDEVDCENHVPIHKCTLDNRKFICSNNKTCIDLKHVCDHHPHCPDKSDENSLCTLPALSCKKHGCSHDCVQLPKGPRCICPMGYHNIDEKNCQDINECEQFDICDQKCRNTAGSYECYCEHKYVLKKDKKQCKVIGGEALMVFTSKTEIRAFSLGTEIYFSVAKNLKQVVGVDYNGNHVYWTDIYAEHESIVRSLEDGSEREVLVTSGLGLPEDLSVDWLTGNIYFTDAEKQQISVCNSDGYICTVLVNKDIRKPRGIVLNVNDGDMYWTDWGKPAAIAYAMMDGSHDKTFVSSDIHWPNGLALDYYNDRLYWTDARKMTLESIKLDGTDRRIVLQGVVKHPYAIAVFEDKLYWSDWATHSIQSCNKFSGKDHRTIIKEEKEYIYGISIFHSALKKRLDNPCSLALCSDMCLLKGSNYSCACPQNKVLGHDGHVCQNVGPKQMLIVGYKNHLVHVEHQFLGKHDITSMPTSAKNIGCMAYNTLENSLFISDLESKKIISLNLNSGASKPLDIGELGHVVAMDYDRRGNNLYLCDEDRAVLEVVNLNTMTRKILIHDMYGDIIEDVAVVPDEGVMFVAFHNRNHHTSHIDRFYMDGTLRTHSKEHGLIGPISLHYDENLHVIFYADAETGDIESTSIEGDDRHSFRSLSTHPVGLTSLNNDLFWVNENSRRLYWAEKQGLSNYNKKISLDLPEDPEKLHIVSVTPKIHLASPCHMNNNGCSHLCLMSQKTVICACSSGWELSSDNRTCIQRANCHASEFLCVESNKCIPKHFVCNGHQDCATGEDERDCVGEKKCQHGFFQCKNGDCINQVNVCDHKYDCTDKSDERNCNHVDANICPPQHFQCSDGKCINERFFCDGIQDCNDDSDEKDCHSKTCSENQFRCDSGSCIPSSWECDHEYDCTDFSDEHAHCASGTCHPSMFTCNNGKCIHKSLICDDADDCGDNSDEISCYMKHSHDCGPEQFPCSSNNSICLPTAAKCNDTTECPKGEDEQGCTACAEQEFSCQNKQCVPMYWLCDGHDDCGDNSDEFSELCSHRRENATDLTVSEIQDLCEHGYRCKSGDCIDLARVCDESHDCYDGSDEDGMCSKACVEKNPCTHKCIKTPHGAMCACKPGYKLMGDGYSCTDIDECLMEPAVCSQLCHNEEGGYTCDCYQQFVLRTDKKSCKAEGAPVSFLFTTDGQIRELSQKTLSLSVLYSERTPKMTGLDSLSHPLTVYFCMEAAATIQKIDVKTQTLHYMEGVGRPQKLAVDWATNNIYYYNSDSQAKSIAVCNMEEKLCAKLINIDAHKQVSAIAVDSVNQVLFYALSSWWVFNSPSYVIYKYNLDGSKRTELQQTTTGYINALTFDYNKRQLFYMDQHASQVKSITYEGKLKKTIFTNITHSVGLKFFENHLFYLTRGGNVNKCKLYDNRKCDTFRLHSYASDLFTIIQDTLQPFVSNPCEKHTCSYLCLPSGKQFRCLCKDGSVVAKSEKCSESADKIASGDGMEYEVHSVPVLLNSSEHKKSRVILTVILVPLFLIIFAVIILYVLRRRQNSHMNISMRFYNPTYANHRDELEKPILTPGQHEYSNPVHFDKGDEIPTNISPKKVQFDCV